MLGPLCGDSTAPFLSLTKCALGMSTLSDAFTFPFYVVVVDLWWSIYISVHCFFVLLVITEHTGIH